MSCQTKRCGGTNKLCRPRTIAVRHPSFCSFTYVVWNQISGLSLSRLPGLECQRQHKPWTRGYDRLPQVFPACQAALLYERGRLRPHEVSVLRRYTIREDDRKPNSGGCSRVSACFDCISPIRLDRSKVLCEDAGGGQIHGDIARTRAVGRPLSRTHYCHLIQTRWGAVRSNPKPKTRGYIGASPG